MTSVPANDGGSRSPRLRLFVAVDVPEQVTEEIEAVITPLRAAAPGLRWTETGSWHLTAAFLGGVEASLLDKVTSAVARAAAGSHPFTLRLSGTAGTFPGGVLWAGLEPAPLLDELAAALRVHAAALGLPGEDRPFHAHLTLARSARGTRLPDDIVERYDGPRLPWTVREIALMRSRLAVGGARHEIIERFILGEPFSRPA
jgi:RNA 2',3'-cyclic 3'-phosphodiesterase